MRKHFLLGGVAAAAVAAAVSFGAGTSDAAGLQLFQFDAGTFQPVFAGGPTGAGQTNYILDYKLSAATKTARKPAVRLELRTETSKTFGDSYDAATWKAATKLLNLKEEPSSTAALRGAELSGSADVLANFGAIDPNADDFTVRVYGLWDPVYRDRLGRTWSENRVLVLTYKRSGDEYDRQLDAVRLVDTKQELEGDPIQLPARKK